MTQTRTTPPRGLSRRAFLAGLGISGLSLAFMTSFPNIAFAANKVLISDEEWERIPAGDLYIDFGGADTASFTSNNSLVMITTLNNWGHNSEDYIYAYLKPGTKIPASNYLNVNNAWTLLIPKAALDVKTGKRYDLELKADIKLWANSDSDFISSQINDRGSVGTRIGLYCLGPKRYIFFNAPDNETASIWAEYNITARVIGIANKTVGIWAEDIDIGRRGPEGYSHDGHAGYNEGFDFLSPIGSMYANNPNLLLFENNNTSIHAPVGNPQTGDDANWNQYGNGDIRSMFYTTFTDCSDIRFKWRGMDCGTTIWENAIGYPKVAPEPLKEAINKKVFL